MRRDEIKEVLADLRLTVAEVGRQSGGISRAAVWKYFQGALRSAVRRQQIEAVLRARAKERRVKLPKNLWPEDSPVTPPLTGASR